MAEHKTIKNFTYKKIHLSFLPVFCLIPKCVSKPNNRVMNNHIRMDKRLTEMLTKDD